MHPDVLHLGPFTLHSYGLLLAVSFFVGILLAGRRAPARGLSADLVFDTSLVIIFAAVIGARFMYVVFHLSEMKSLLDVVSLWSGGLTVYGGVLGAMAGRYSLSGAGVTYSYVPGEMVLGGSAPGGVVEFGGRIPLSSRLSLAGALGYRVARISPVRRSGTVGRVVLEPADLLNADGSRASVDLSGFSLTLALAFAFGPR